MLALAATLADIVGVMSAYQRPVTAVLGPTNTGKTHLAIERMCGHSSGMIGFPLRLLAREVYDRVVKLKGKDRVALMTGEERIVPPNARWFLCTAESMPLDREVSFLALDEAQLGADPERGHVFTDRLLRARGRDETMILGSDTLRPMVKALVPEAEIVNRPRFSTLSYAGAKKLSRLPKRSAIVAFSAEEVYAVAEMLRRLRGGAAVVMGALSPRTRNAQVAMFQAGEVDYLVATDAIGMGLNMDVSHVAFAGLTKFDGKRQRRLTISEMAQIAGRAGRHQRDGTFGALVEEGPDAFTPEEVHAIEEHRFPSLDFLYWRDGEPDHGSINDLIGSLEMRSDHPQLRSAPVSTDLAVLKRLAEEDWVRERARSPAQVARLWSACGLPDFRKLGADPHTRLVSRLYRHLSEGDGHIPSSWFAQEVARLEDVRGDVETIAGRVAAVRTWAYIAHRADWLAEPERWAARTVEVEERLSDALHASLTQRFVDKRTTVLLRQIGADAGALPVVIGEQGEVMVEDHSIGTLEGFRFTVAADARAGDKRLLLAAAEKRLGKELGRRARELAAAEDVDFSLIVGEAQVEILWRGVPVAVLATGPNLAQPRVKLDRALDRLDPPDRKAVQVRADRWLAEQIAKHLPVFGKLDAATRDAEASGPLRAMAAALLQAGGILPRRAAGQLVEALDPLARRELRKLGVTIGTLDLFAPALLKAGAAQWRRTLMGPSEAPREGATVLPRGAPGADLNHGFRPLGQQAVRIDLVERIARAAHDARMKGSQGGRAPFTPDPALATSIGLQPDTLSRLMAQLGFRTAKPDDQGKPRWMWQGLPALTKPKAAPRDNAFAALAGMLDG
jgi:ATP-dependent RNA helicase SUPV3L1/SUV3